MKEWLRQKAFLRSSMHFLLPSDTFRWEGTCFGQGSAHAEAEACAATSEQQGHEREWGLRLPGLRRPPPRGCMLRAGKLLGPESQDRRV